MEPDHCGFGWKPVRVRQLYLIRLWEIAALKQHFIKGLKVVFTILLCVLLLFLPQFGTPWEPPIWKVILFLLITLSAVLGLWGWVIYNDEKELWGGKMYTRTVTCIGHTHIRTRLSHATYLDIMGEAGEVLENIETPGIIVDSVKHQEKLLAVTNDPQYPDPVRLVPLHPPYR